MATKLWAIILMVFCTLVTSSAQLVYKFGVNQEVMLNKAIWIFVGLCLYGIGALMLIVALKGGELSVLYPIIATSYVWVTVLAFFLFQESLKFSKWIGVFSIILGVSLIGRGGTR